MSLINDALQQARRSPPPNLPAPLPPLQPVPEQPPLIPAWFWLSLVALLAAGGIFFGGWALARSRVQVAVAPPGAAVPAPVAAVNYPSLAKPPPVATAPKPVVQPPAVSVAAPLAAKPTPVAAQAAPSFKPTVVAAAAPPVAKPPAPVVAYAPPAAPPTAPAAPTAPAPLPLNPPGAPRLQGIFYSPTSPTAIVDGKIVRVGNQLKEYRVMAISKSMLTLMDPDGKAFQISLGN